MLVIMVVMMLMGFVVMIMVMGVGRDHAGRRGTKELGEFRILLDFLRPAFAADMAIEADDMIAFGHHHVQVMAHHENAAAMAFANAGNQFIEFHFTEEIDGLDRLIENQQIGLAQQGPRQQRPLQFATGERGDARFFQMGNADFVQSPINVLFALASR